MVVRAGMADRETVGLLGINIDRRFTIMFAIAAVVAGLAGLMYTPINAPNYHMGMDFLVLSFVVVVVGGMGSLTGAFLASLLLGAIQTFAVGLEYSLADLFRLFGVSSGFQAGILKDLLRIQIAHTGPILPYLIMVFMLIFRPKGLMGTRET
jgi:branched-subunit amino acid ABC-type transport system permease component